MGILGKFGVEFLAGAYKSFIYSKINNELQSNSAATVELIATRLQHRIKSSVIARTTKASTVPVAVGSIIDGTDYLVMEWIGSDYDGYRGNSDVVGNPPNWSGILDLDAGNANLLDSPGTDRTKVDRYSEINLV